MNLKNFVAMFGFDEETKENPIKFRVSDSYIAGSVINMILYILTFFKMWDPTSASGNWKA